MSPAPNAWKCRAGEMRHLSAAARPGWVLSGWCDGAYNVLSATPEYDLVMTGNKTVRGNVGTLPGINVNRADAG